MFVFLDDIACGSPELEDAVECGTGHTIAEKDIIEIEQVVLMESYHSVFDVGTDLIVYEEMRATRKFD
jgi:hypothetical protein